MHLVCDDKPGLGLARNDVVFRPDLRTKWQAVACFLKDAESFLRQMRAAVEKGDLVEVGRLGHRLKGTTGHIAAEPAREAAKRVEHFLLHPGEQAEVEESVRAFERECELLKAVFTEYQATTSPVQGDQ